MRKALFVLILVVLEALNTQAQIRVNGYFDGYWDEWEETYHTDLYGTLDPTLPYMKIYGNYSGFCAYTNNTHPSTYFFKFQISNYYEPDKKTRKEHLNHNVWYDYNGSVEYYVNNELPTIKDIMKRGSIFGRIPTISPSQATRKRTVNAKIQIAPYKDHPRIYNIWFEDVGVAIDLGTIHF